MVEQPSSPLSAIDARSPSGADGALVNHTRIAIYTTDRDLRCTWIYAPGATFNTALLIGQRAEELLPAPEAAKLTALKQQVLDTGEGISCEVPISIAGETRYYDLTVEPLRDEGAAVDGLRIAAIDITARRAAEAQLLMRERALRAQAERSAAELAQLHAVTSALSQVLTLQQVAEVIVARSAYTLGAASSVVRLVNSDDGTLDILASAGVPEAVNERWRRVPLDAPVPIALAARQGKPFFIESREELLPWFAELGATISDLGLHAFVIAPLLVQERIIGSLVLTFDSPRAFDAEDRSFILALASQCAQALERARLYAQAQEAVQARDTFITVASHDLRSPITALLGQAQLLERQVASAGAGERVLRSARAIAQQAARLSRMITALLDLSRIEMGQISIEPVPLDLVALVQRIVAEIQPTLTDHTLIIEAAGAPLAILGDELRLEQVFHNLIGNAVKYSPEGGTVLIRLMRRSDDVCAEVSDQGVGIPADALPQIFERFYRAPNAATFAISGLGVGLYIVREIVALHGGSVSVSSAEGSGSTFSVVLPVG